MIIQLDRTGCIAFIQFVYFYFCIKYRYVLIEKDAKKCTLLKMIEERTHTTKSNIKVLALKIKSVEYFIMIPVHQDTPGK